MNTKEVVVKNVPAWLKLSEITKIFEKYGDIIRIAVDEKNRRSKTKVSIFITYENHIAAMRAVQHEIEYIEGHRVEIEKSHTIDRRRHKPYPHRKIINGHTVGY